MSDNRPETSFTQRIGEMLNSARNDMFVPVIDSSLFGTPHSVLLGSKIAADVGSVSLSLLAVKESLIGEAGDAVRLGLTSIVLLAGAELCSRLDVRKWEVERPERIE